MIGISIVLGRTTRPFDGDPEGGATAAGAPARAHRVFRNTGITGRNEVEDGEAVAPDARSAKIAAFSKGWGG